METLVHPTGSKGPGTRPRRVFGRLSFVSEGKVHRVELTKQGLTIWRYRSRTKRTLTFADLVTKSEGQLLLL